MANRKFFDVQVNGYAGYDFNSASLSADDWHAACQQLRRDGTDRFLPTVITDELDAMIARLQRIVAVCEQDPLVRQCVAGIHIEGPFINAQPGYVGAHPASAVRPAELDAMKRLLEAAAGMTRIVTLAPECDRDLRVTKYLANQGVTVSAGHCNASLDEIHAAIDAGVTMFTHLGNGCPMQIHRHDNIIQRVLSCSDRLWISFIADGVHVPFVALRNYLNSVGPEHAVITTDAMTAAGLGPGRYQFGPLQVDVDDRLAAWAPDRSHLMGSAITMPRVAENLRVELGLSDAVIQKLTYDNPLRAAGVAA